MGLSPIVLVLVLEKSIRGDDTNGTYRVGLISPIGPIGPIRIIAPNAISPSPSTMRGRPPNHEQTGLRTRLTLYEEDVCDIGDGAVVALRGSPGKRGANFRRTTTLDSATCQECCVYGSERFKDRCTNDSSSGRSGSG